jgi:hypothetical protein
MLKREVSGAASRFPHRMDFERSDHVHHSPAPDLCSMCRDGRHHGVIDIQAHMPALIVATKGTACPVQIRKTAVAMSVQAGIVAMKPAVAMSVQAGKVAMKPAFNKGSAHTSASAPDRQPHNSRARAPVKSSESALLHRALKHRDIGELA